MDQMMMMMMMQSFTFLFSVIFDPFVGSPFSCLVSDIRKVMVSGEGLEKVPIGRPAVFTVDTQEDVGYEPEIKITGKTMILSDIF